MAARENLRTTRDTVPRDGWHAVNDLYLYVTTEADRGADRRVRERFLGRVISEGRRVDGVLATAMTHDEAYVMWRLGRALERADMTTRVLGVRAADVLSQPQGDVDTHDEVQWMGVLRSVWGLQMYQRAVRGPIEGSSVVRFLLDHDRFPRAVRALLREMRLALAELPDPGGPLDAVAHVESVLRECDRRQHRRHGPRRGDGRAAGGDRPRRPADHRPLPPGRREAAGSDRSAARRMAAGPVTRAADLLPQFLADHLALTRRQVEADRLIGASLAGHLVHDLPGADGAPARDRPWRLDPVPLVLDGEVFDGLAAAVPSRLRGMEALLGDLYGPASRSRPAGCPRSSCRRRRATGSPPSARRRRRGG